MNQSSLFSIDSDLCATNLLPKEGLVNYYPEFLGEVESLNLLNQLQKSLQWEADQLIIFGRLISTRRKVAWIGDPKCTYTYSGVKKQPQSWTPELLIIKRQLEELPQAEFNSCLLNFYHDGADGMGWHSDDEKELDAQSPIASLSLGSARKFSFKHKKDKSTTSLFLENGSALIMHAPTQQFWQHALLKTKTIHTPRINLTFRRISISNA
ncbi:alpha-ketoglutarate-dependent dioxygenase AlkB family protein [Polynucleobacter asymbioticus]|uniref:DNA-N1-methyladenine dioxygenase n=1 Tax=Polynucleobacter asymbioticus (strain DSM 18221 / CIP 109841 / QLW-P1DMWA-1) TaxID=312153 RepID=A4SZF3_POLAQ|nr:alpha-ketoglutarate-dependent dioxygenase AlkB [Polynucleobacter asymbioticus]ABP34867.1 DNA-N1-methyladenine dioxygenase [Polynucleobacter asymbioticus QLW-P1DMWA-1]APC06679.1 DNA methylase [Polynucleobacter asymbioticus]